MQQDADATTMSAPDGAHRDLRLVALLELGKGCLSGTVAGALLLFGAAQVRAFIARIGETLHFDPGHSALARVLAAITSETVLLAAAAIGTYACLRFVLSWGLWHARAWASWLGAATVLLYLPFCAFGLWRYPGWPTAAALALNLLIVFILIRDLCKRRRVANARESA